MSRKKTSLALVAVMALTAIAASSSSATVATTRAEWYTGANPGTTLPVGTTPNINKKVEVREHPTIGKKATFSVIISGLKVDITAEEIECVSCKIQNKEITTKAGAAAFGEGQIRFKKATVMEPVGCTISGEGGTLGEILTRKLVIHADFMDTVAANEKDFVKFIPAAGATTAFVLFNLGGGGCESIEGGRNVFGTLFAESGNNTGVFAKTQALVFGQAVQETADAALTVGNQPVTLTGTGGFSLENGAEFAVKP
jgi:hypothetical protein